MSATASILRAATALAGRQRASGTADLDTMPQFERRWWIGGARVSVKAALDVDEMTNTYGVAQFGQKDWDEAPAVIRNDVRNRMAAVVASILAES